jgi:hypothetical protein
MSIHDLLNIIVEVGQAWDQYQAAQPNEDEDDPVAIHRATLAEVAVTTKVEATPSGGVRITTAVSAKGLRALLATIADGDGCYGVAGAIADEMAEDLAESIAVGMGYELEDG